MKNNIVENNTVIHSNFDTEFENNINLGNLILPKDNNIELINIIVNQYYWDLSEGVPTEIKPILIISKQSCSTIAYALHNTLGNQSFQEFSCAFVGRGSQLSECFENTYEFSTVHLSNLEKLPYTFNQALLNVVKDGFCVNPKMSFHPEPTKILVEGLIILSASDKAPVIEPISKHIDTIVKIGNYTTDDIFQILQQRADFYDLSFEDKNHCLGAISQATRCNVRDAIDILHWAYRVCRAKNQYTITNDDLYTVFLHRKGLG